MKTISNARILCSLACLWAAATSVTYAGDWPQAAGPNGDFVVVGDAPDQFSVAKEQAVLWHTPLPNTGQGAVVVAGDRAFVASHAPTDGDAEMGSLIIAQCFDANSGEELWRHELPGARETDLSSLFSDNTAASPVVDVEGQRVCFVNVGGSVKCFDFAGAELWSHEWVPFGRHHARQHEPFFHDGNVVLFRVRPSDLDPAVTTKEGAKPLGRVRDYWTFLHAYDFETGELSWIAETGTGVHSTSLAGSRADGSVAILTGRGGGHQPPEEPYGISLIDADDGSTIWDLPVKGYAAHQNLAWTPGLATLFAGKNHLIVDMESAKIIDTVSLMKGVQICRQIDGRYVTEQNQTLKNFKKPLTLQSNLLVGDYHYFRAHAEFLIGRVHTGTGKVEYLEVPVQVVRRAGQEDEFRWSDPIPNDMRNSAGFLATQDRRNAGTGWGHVSAASPTAIGDLIYLPTMAGTVYVLKWNAPVLDEKALVSISDLGPAGEAWSLSSLSFANGRIYARTLKELICIGAPD